MVSRHGKGERHGPETKKELVTEWNALEEKYGVKIYYDLFPRHLPNADCKRQVVELYQSGAKRFGMWDTYHRLTYAAMWSFLRRVGHRDGIEEADVGEGEFYRNFVIYSIGGKDLSRYDPVWGS
ncbi:MAG: hypothetical protein IIX01_00930 [Clostridia bacterium]|nr:hypothetical protein [Clostridia bacterium]